MSSQVFSNSTPDEFLQVFIDQTRSIAPFASCTSLQSFIHRIVFKSSAYMEEKYREAEALPVPLTPSSYATLIVSLKNSIGGAFQVV